MSMFGGRAMRRIAKRGDLFVVQKNVGTFFPQWWDTAEYSDLAEAYDTIKFLSVKRPKAATPIVVFNEYGEPVGEPLR